MAWAPWRRWLAANGVTSVAPTFITGPLDKMLTQVEDAHRHAGASPGSAQAGARLLGAHLEGPFISPDRLGAHRAQWRHYPDSKHLVALAGVTPEHWALSRWHLGNAQRGLHQREPGVLVTDAVADAGVSKVAPTVSTHPSGADDAPVLAGGIHTGAMVVAGLISAGFDPGWVVDSFTRVPARTIGCDQLGTLEVGRWADLVRWTPDWAVESTWIAGERTANRTGVSPSDRSDAHTG